MIRQDLDNPIIDSPSSTTQSRFFKIKSAKINSIATADDNILLTEPSTTAMPDPLYNNVKITQSGHMQEFDDTPGAERVLLGHKAGHYIEFYNDGKTSKIFGKDFEIVLDDKNLIVSGNLNVVVNGSANILVHGNALTKVGGDYDLKVAGNMSIVAEGSFKVQSNLAMSLESLDKFTLKADGLTRLWSNGNVYIDGAQVRFNDPYSEPAPLNLLFGLDIPDSLIEPTASAQFITRTQLLSTLSLEETGLTIPKTR